MGLCIMDGILWEMLLERKQKGEFGEKIEIYLLHEEKKGFHLPEGKKKIQNTKYKYKYR